MTTSRVRKRRYSPKQHDFPDMTGRIFGCLTVLSYVGVNELSKRVWRCQCKCGKEISALGESLRSGNSKSCGCARLSYLSGLKGTTRPELSVGEGIAARNSIIYGYKHTAMRRGKIWNLTTDEAARLFKGDCHYCGVAPCQRRSNKHENGDYVYNGIDRVANDLGYEIGNVVSCCSKCNWMKGTMPYGEFLAWIKQAYEHVVMKEMHCARVAF